MPMFKVMVHQFVEEVAEIDVEADTLEEAIHKGHRALEGWGELDWSDCSSTQDKDVYRVEDADGNEVWVPTHPVI